MKNKTSDRSTRRIEARVSPNVGLLYLNNYHRALLQQVQKSIPFSSIYGMDVPQVAGIYFVSDFRGVLYIGQASNLRRRFYEHLEHGRNELLNKAINQSVGRLQCGWIEVSSKNQRNDIEKQLVQAFLPPCNKILFKKSSNQSTTK